MTESVDIFRNAIDAESLAVSIKALPEAQQIAFEKCTVSDYSGKPIGDAEELIRSLDQPVHIVNGVVVPAAFTDAEIRGMSVNRLAFINQNDALRLAFDRVAAVNQRKTLEAERQGVQPSSPQRKTVAFTTFKTSELRAVMSCKGVGARRGLGVYDTAKVDDHSHGDIFLLLADRQAKRSIRSEWFALANKALIHL